MFYVEPHFTSCARLQCQYSRYRYTQMLNNAQTNQGKFLKLFVCDVLSKIQQTFTECTQLLLLLLELEGRFFRLQDRTAYIHSMLALCGSTLFQVVYFTEKRKWSHTFSPLVLFLSRMQIPADWTSLKGLCEFVSAARLGCRAKEQVLSVSNFIESAAGGSANGCRHGETDAPVSLKQEPVCVSFCLLY